MWNVIGMTNLDANENDYQYRSIQGRGILVMFNFAVATQPLKKEKMTILPKKEATLDINKINKLEFEKALRRL